MTVDGSLLPWLEEEGVSVLVYDSGVGGLPYLEVLQRRLGGRAAFYYVADSAYFPFGDKPESLLVQHIETVVQQLVARWQPELVLIACNTASVLALDRLRSCLGVPVVGTVPAIKPAAASSSLKRIALLATERTLSAGYLDHLIRLHAGDCAVCRVAAGGLVDFIERELFRADEVAVQAKLAEVVQRINEQKVDRVVLGCTHFLHIASALQAMLPRPLEVVDSLAGVTLQALRLLPPTAASAEESPRILWPTRPAVRWRYWARKYRLHLKQADC